MLSSSIPRHLDPQVPPEDLQSLASGQAAFGMDLFQSLRGEGENLFLSPYSIYLALAMTYAGARHQTAAQMAQVLHLPLSQHRLHPALNALEQTLARRAEELPAGQGDAFRLAVANALWGQQGYDFLQPFLDDMAHHYGSGLRPLDFARDPEAARSVINAWVSEQTGGRIQNLIPSGALDALTRLVLANAIYFRASWRFPFTSSRTRPAPFTLTGGSTVQVPMMHFQEPARLAYGAGEGFQAVQLPYAGGALAMLILVPDTGRLASFEAGLSPGRLEEISRSLRVQPLDLVLPRFRFETRFRLKPVLAGLGMVDALQLGAADFSGIDGSRQLYISDVFHKAFVAVDEQGTEAAAATAVVMSLTAAPSSPVRLTVDRPFLFAIQDLSSGLLLFLGRVANPVS